MADVPIFDFDAGALFAALDVERSERALSWRQVADEIWQLSAVLNDRRRDHPISPSTITGLPKRRDCSCQHALFYLRWLGRSPESFLDVPGGHVVDGTLPDVGPDRRLRWDLGKLYEALNAQRLETQLTWPELARTLRCTPSQLTGLRTARFATGMRVAMRIVQWLGRPASDFVYAAGW